MRPIKANEFTPLPNAVLVTDLDFGEKVTRGGLIITDDDGAARGIHPRWCHVWKVGSKVTDVKAGDWLLVEHGRWTRKFILDLPEGEVGINMIDNTAILLVGDEKPDDVWTGQTKEGQEGVDYATNAYNNS